MEFVSLELELSVERLKRYLQQHPEKSAELALAYFEDFSVLAIEHKKFEQSHEILQKKKYQASGFRASSVIFITFPS